MNSRSVSSQQQKKWTDSLHYWKVQRLKQTLPLPLLLPKINHISLDIQSVDYSRAEQTGSESAVSGHHLPHAQVVRSVMFPPASAPHSQEPKAEGLSVGGRVAYMWACLEAIGFAEIWLWKGQKNRTKGSAADFCPKDKRFESWQTRDQSWRNSRINRRAACTVVLPWSLALVCLIIFLCWARVDVWCNITMGSRNRSDKYAPCWVPNVRVSVDVIQHHT